MLCLHIEGASDTQNIDGWQVDIENLVFKSYHIRSKTVAFILVDSHLNQQ